MPCYRPNATVIPSYDLATQTLHIPQLTHHWYDTAYLFDRFDYYDLILKRDTSVSDFRLLVKQSVKLEQACDDHSQRRFSRFNPAHYPGPSRTGNTIRIPELYVGGGRFSVSLQYKSEWKAYVLTEISVLN